MTSDLAVLRQALLEVSPKQQLALESLATGATHTEAAMAAGVDRKTVTRWKGYHPGFQAALASWQAVAAVEQIEKVCRIRSRALDVIAARLEDDGTDIATALTVLNAITIDTVGRPSPPDTPGKLLDEAINRTKRELPPLPPPNTTDEIAYLMNHPQPSDIERAERATIERLAAAAGIDDDTQDQP